MSQCCNIVNSNLRIKFRWNLKRNWYISIQENAFENAVCEMASILSRPRGRYLDWCCMMNTMISEVIVNEWSDYDENMLFLWIILLTTSKDTHHRTVTMPLPEQILSHYLCRHLTSLGHNNELNVKTYYHQNLSLCREAARVFSRPDSCPTKEI